MKQLIAIMLALLAFGCAQDTECPVCPDPAITAKCGMNDLAYYPVDTTWSVVWYSAQQDGMERIASFLMVSKLCTENVDTLFANVEPNGWYSVDGLSVNYYRAKYHWPEFTLQGCVIYRDGQEPNTTDLICKTPCKVWKQ